MGIIESTATVMKVKPIIKRIPKLAVPLWDELARLPKLRDVVRALKMTALVVLVE